MSNTNLRTQSSSVLQNHTVSSCSTSKVQEKTQLSRIKCMNSLRAIQSQLKFLIETLQDFGNMPIFKRTFSQDLDLLENHLTKQIISQTDCKTTLTKLRTTFENAFSSEIQSAMPEFYKIDSSIIYDQYGLKGTSTELDSNGALHVTLCQDVDNFYDKYKALYIDQLQKQRDKDELSRNTYFVEYTGIELKHFRDTLLQHLGNVKKSVAERTHHQRQYERMVNKRQMQTQESKIDTGKALVNSLVVMESNGTESEVQDDSSMSGNDTDDNSILSNLKSLLKVGLTKYSNGENQVVLKSSAVTTTDASNKRQQQPDSTSSTSTLATAVTANGNFDL
ncbi:hypothetical protein Tco_0227147 [Tanacetum coccineum]